MVSCKLGEKGCWKDGKCHYIHDCENKVLTNADRIRSMSDEELAEWFSTVTDDVLRGSTWSKDGWMKYLQSEVEE